MRVPWRPPQRQAWTLQSLLSQLYACLGFCLLKASADFSARGLIFQYFLMNYLCISWLPVHFEPFDFYGSVFATWVFLPFVLKSVHLFLTWTKWFLLFKMYFSVLPHAFLSLALSFSLSLSLSPPAPPSAPALTEARWPSCAL